MLSELLLLMEANWSEEQIEKWLRSMKIKNYTINPDKTVDVAGDVNLFNRGLDNLPIKFGTVSGNFLVRHNKFRNLRGFPHEIGGDLTVSYNPGIKLQGGDGMIVHGRVLTKGTELTTLEGVGQSFSEIHGSTFPNLEFNTHEITSGGIGLVLIKGLVIRSAYGPFGKALNIIMKYLGQGKKGLLLCQDELIEAGLEEFAKL